MHAVEFQTLVKENAIYIPDEYQDEFHSNMIVKVVIMTEERPKERKHYTKEDFTGLSIPTKGWKFDRDEANER